MINIKVPPFIGGQVPNPKNIVLIILIDPDLPRD